MKKLLSVFLFVVCFAPALAQSAPTPAFWKVTKGDSTVYLLGSMHFGRTDFYPLPNVIVQAFNHSKRLVVEVDILSLAPELAMKAMLKYSALPLGKTLKSTLSSSTYALLASWCKSNQLPVAVFDNFQPWFVALQLVEAEIKKTSLKPSLGVDLHFLGLGGRQVDQLETLDSQLGLFSQFTLVEQEQFLLQTFKDLEKGPQFLESMADAWYSGDMSALETQMIDPFKDNENNKRLYDALFTHRNISMTTAVKEYLKQPQDVFFIVGAGHMIGQGGIVRRLKMQGYDVRRVTYPAH